MIKIKNISKFFGQKPILNNVSFNLEKGELIGLIGPSGSGKSTLLKILANVFNPDSGSFIVDSPDGEELKVGLALQEGGLFDSMNVLENVAFPLVVNTKSDARVLCSHKKAMERSFHMLEQVGLSKSYLKYPGELSGGMRKRVGIARALVDNPQLVLLDDPTAGLDPVSANVIINLISKLHFEFRPITIMVSHDLRRLIPKVQRVISLFDRKIKFDGLPENILDQAPEVVVNFIEKRFNLQSLSEPNYN